MTSQVEVPPLTGLIHFISGKRRAKGTLKKDQRKTCLMILMRFFSDFLYKSICCGYSFELHRMSPHNICFYKEVERKYTYCKVKTMELLDCALTGVCAVIRSNTVLY